MPWGAAIGAVGALGSAEINSSNNKSSSSSSQSAETQEASDLALSKGETIANRGYTPYNGPVVQGLSDAQSQGIDQSQTGYDPAKADYAGATTALNGLPTYDSATMSKYMDPYVSSVLTPQLNQENINYGAQKSALLNSKAGAFGGDRSALAAGQLDYAHDQTIASDTANTYSAAYTNAQNAFFQDKNSQMQAATDLANVGNDVSQMNTQQIQTLMQAGGVQQALGQAQLNFNYQQFVENRDWDVTNLQPLLNSIDASKGVSQTSINTPASGSALGTALGAAATVAGAYFTGGKSSSGPGNTSGDTQSQINLDQDNQGAVNATNNNISNMNDYTGNYDYSGDVSSAPSIDFGD